MKILSYAISGLILWWLLSAYIVSETHYIDNTYPCEPVAFDGCE